jgi:predicted DNA binding CopG/RHH family protein
MATIDSYEQEVLAAYESGVLKSVAGKAELAKLKAAARATATKDKRVNIRLSSGDLQDIQAKALQEGMPYQTLIASILHKYVTGRLEERASLATASSVAGKPSKGRASKSDA